MSFKPGVIFASPKYTVLPKTFVAYSHLFQKISEN